MNVTLRAETAADISSIEALTVAAFLHAPHTSHTEQHIVNALRQAGRLTLSLIAEVERRVIGHVALSPVSISDGACGWFGLGPICVLPELQRQGTGTQLMRAALQELRAQGAAGCVVLGEPAYYGRFGFRHEPALVLPGVAAEYFQALAFDAPLPKGIVQYDSAFSL